MLSQTDIRFFTLAVGSSNIGRMNDTDISCRCPVCGDSSTKRNSKRLHLYEKNGITNVNCFNGDCSVVNRTMWSFLRDFYPDLLPQYKRENFAKDINNLKNGTTLGSLVKPQKPVEVVKPVVTQDLSPYMTPLKDADDGISYLKNRGIGYRPTKFGQWYYGNQDLKIGDTLYKLTDSVIVPLYYEAEMYGFYSRSTKEKNFVTYMNDANIGYKVWNWFKVDKDEPVYIFEGIFDAISSGYTNIIALMGAKLPDDRLAELKNPVFCLDADRTGLLNSLAYAKKGYQVYVQPNDIFEKDFNDIMINNPELNLPEVIRDNLFTGISAEIRIKKLL